MSEKLSFGAHMLAEYGHKKGENHGANGQGITEPFEAVSNARRTELGSRNQELSKFVLLRNLDANSGAATVYELFARDDDTDFHYGKGLLDIFPAGNKAIAVFKNEEIAQKAIEKFHGTQFGWQTKRVELWFIGSKDLPESDEEYYGPDLSTFLHDEKESRKVKSQTVLLTHLSNHPEKWLNLLLEKTISYVQRADPYAEDSDDEEFDFDCTSSFVVDSEAGMILAKFNHRDHADNFVETWNGRYFKSRTIYATKVLDKEIDELIEEHERAKQKRAAKPKGGLFLRPIHYDVTKEDVISLFPNYQIHDVHFPPRGGSAIVFLGAEDAEEIATKFRSSLRLKDRIIAVSLFDFDKKNMRQNPREPSPSVDSLTQQASGLQISNAGGKRGNSRGRPKTFDVVLKNLHFEATEEDIRDLFSGFDVQRVSFARPGLGFVALPTVEKQQRAINLSGQKILGRKVIVEPVRDKF
ncbi:unnamed protein product [Periconia digitata]|uniref:Uncharacterized protein n=1 Tax=Periconia digitata TaxID=1303443 RepID=A0A9W4UJS3_9PLEO|nr:unnamed protein product [Periconia digitata]